MDPTKKPTIAEILAFPVESPLEHFGHCAPDGSEIAISREWYEVAKEFIRATQDTIKESFPNAGG